MKTIFVMTFFILAGCKATDKKDSLVLTKNPGEELTEEFKTLEVQSLLGYWVHGSCNPINETLSQRILILNEALSATEIRYKQSAVTYFNDNCSGYFTYPEASSFTDMGIIKFDVLSQSSGIEIHKGDWLPYDGYNTPIAWGKKDSSVYCILLESDLASFPNSKSIYKGISEKPSNGCYTKFTGFQDTGNVED